MFNWVCWNRQCCCLNVFDEYCNKVFVWWLSWVFLCGILACCIAGFVTANRFGFSLNAIQCAYERIYYDIIYGQLKETYPKWEGLVEIRNTYNHLNNINLYLNSNESSFTLDNFTSYKKYNRTHNLTDLERNVLKYLYFPIQEVFINKFLTTVNEINYERRITLIKESNILIKTLLDPFIQLNRTLTYLNDAINYTSQINKLDQLISMINNFSSYKTKIIQDFSYLVKIARGLGKIVPIIFFALLLTFVVASGALLITYYCKKINQQWWILPMHIAWNGLRAFIFLFFCYGCLYGMLFLYSRDLIAYLKYAFSEENLNSNDIVIIPPKSQSFLQYCLLNPYIYEDFKENNTINELIKNIVKIDSLIYNNHICPNLDEDINSACEIMKTSLSFGYLGFIINIEDDIKYFKEKIRRDSNIYDTFNCTFINNTINLMYRGLWDFAWETRILCALSCCIGFFGAISVYSFLWSMYFWKKDDEYTSNNNDYRPYNNNISNNIPNNNKKQKYRKISPPKDVDDESNTELVTTKNNQNMDNDGDEHSD